MLERLECKMQSRVRLPYLEIDIVGEDDLFVGLYFLRGIGV
jgi:hypothetical protein